MNKPTDKTSNYKPKFYTKHCDTEYIGFCGLCREQVRVGVGKGLYLKGTNSPVCWYCSEKNGSGRKGFALQQECEEVERLDREYRERTEMEKQTALAKPKAVLLFANDPTLQGVQFEGCPYLERDGKNGAKVGLSGFHLYLSSLCKMFPHLISSRLPSEVAKSDSDGTAQVPA